MPEKFFDSREAEFRRIIRGAIKRGPFTKSQRDVALAFFNHWMQHRTSEKKVVHPGRKKLAEKARVSIRTVASTLELLRDHGAIIAVAHLNGLMGNATEYVVDVVALKRLCGKSKSDIRVNGVQNFPTKGSAKIAHRSCDVVTFPSHIFKRGSGHV